MPLHIAVWALDGIFRAPLLAVREKCEEMRQAAEDAAAQIRNEYSIQLMLIKKDVRTPLCCSPTATLPRKTFLQLPVFLHLTTENVQLECPGYILARRAVPDDLLVT